MAEIDVKMGAVGERDAVLCFKAIGARVMATENADETVKALFTLTQDGVRVIFITEKAAQEAAEAFSRYQNRSDVVIIPIPGSCGSSGYAMSRVHANVEKALGADILFQNAQDKKE